MDRSKFKKITAIAMLSVVAMFSVVSICAAETKAEKVKKRPTATIAVFYGKLAMKDSRSRFIYVEPIDPSFARTIFYVDAMTSYVKDDYAVKFEELQDDDKVAVRYIAYGDLNLAEEVFVVDGEFKEVEYLRRNVRRIPKPKPQTEAAH